MLSQYFFIIKSLARTGNPLRLDNYALGLNKEILRRTDDHMP